MRDFTKYDIWNNSIDFVVDIYQNTQNFPADEKFGLVSQLRRAGISIVSNFAEGCSRTSERDFKRFVEMSLGSAFEVKTQLIIANKLEFLNSKDFEHLVLRIDQTCKQLSALRNKLKD